MNKLCISTEQQEYLDGMDRYIAEFKQLPLEEAKRRAKKSLIDSGILTRDGKERKSICR